MQFTMNHAYSLVKLGSSDHFVVKYLAISKGHCNYCVPVSICETELTAQLDSDFLKSKQSFVWRSGKNLSSFSSV